jgi:hypothetical protein
VEWNNHLTRIASEANLCLLCRCPFVTSHHSRRVAREVFGYGIRGKKLVSEECFDLIFWEIIPKALKEFPSSFKDWLSKHVTGCCGVNRFLSKWEPGVTNHCPCCHRFNEDIYHITTCTDAGRTTIFNQMVDELGSWLEDNHTPPDLTEMIVLYLRGRNTVKMQDLIHYTSRYHPVAVLHDQLGWRSFLEGRISTLLVQEMHNHLAGTSSLISAVDWAKGLVNHLIRITHRQWKYRNSVTHFTIEGRTPAQHHQIIADLEGLMTVDPSTLLPKYRHLYEDEDFEALGRGSSTNKLYWIAAARSAIAASAIERQRRRRRRHETAQQRTENEATDSPPIHPSPQTAPVIPCEPGIRYK